MANNRNKITIENLEPTSIFAKNFKGAATKFRPAGTRSFCLWLDPEQADLLLNDGWNVKFATPRYEDEAPRAYLEIAVNYENVPPKIVLINRHYKKVLDEDTAYMVDSIQIESADVRISPYHWEVNGKSGIKAYLDSMYIVLVDDPLEDKYADIPYSSEKSFMSGEDEG